MTERLPMTWLEYNDYVYNDDGSMKIDRFRMNIVNNKHKEAMEHQLTGEMGVEKVVQMFMEQHLSAREIPHTFTLTKKQTIGQFAEPDGTPLPRAMWGHAMLGWGFSCQFTTDEGNLAKYNIHYRLMGFVSRADGKLEPKYLVAISDSVDTPFPEEKGKTLITTVAKET